MVGTKVSGTKGSARPIAVEVGAGWSGGNRAVSPIASVMAASGSIRTPAATPEFTLPGCSRVSRVSSRSLRVCGRPGRTVGRRQRRRANVRTDAGEGVRVMSAFQVVDRDRHGTQEHGVPKKRV